MSDTLVEIIGYAATVALLLGYLPQTFHTIRTRKTDDIAMGTFLFMGLGSVLFSIYGILIQNWPMTIANGVTTICSAIILGIKLHNDCTKKKQ